MKRIGPEIVRTTSEWLVRCVQAAQSEEIHQCLEILGKLDIPVHMATELGLIDVLHTISASPLGAGESDHSNASM